MKLWNRHTIPKDLEHTYIGRGTQWGNSAKVGEGFNQGEAAARYRWVLARLLAARDPHATKLVKDLDKVENIVCSCTPRACHGDCYVEIYDLIRNKGLPVMEAIREWVKVNGYPYGPDTDGRDHINAYSKSKSALGKRLTNMAGIPVTIPHEGTFESMEGYWYWLGTGCKNEELRYADGFNAKKIGKTLAKVNRPDFKDKIRYALWLRFEQNPTLKENLIKSTLPIVHYYHWNDDDRTVTYPLFDWVTDELKLLRDIYQGKKEAVVVAGSRDITDPKTVEELIEESGYKIDVLVSGGARGVDDHGEAWARKNGVPIRRFIPNWDIEGKGAGFIRNKEMGRFCTRGIVGIKNRSRGSTQMANYLEEIGKPVFRKDYD